MTDQPKNSNISRARLPDSQPVPLANTISKLQIPNIAQKNQTLIWLAITVLFLSLVWKGEAQQIEENDSLKRPSLMFVKPSGYTPQAITPESKEGEKLFLTLNCTACHSIHNIGGTMGPILDGVGQKRDLDFLYSRLAATPQQKEKYRELIKQQPGYLDTHIRLTESTARKIASFLLTLPEPPGGFVVIPHVTRWAAESHGARRKFQPAKISESSQQGKQLFDKFGCQACHTVGNVGGWLGPRLDGVFAIHDRKYIIDHITDAQVHGLENSLEETKPATSMPKFQATKEEIEKIADYLDTLAESKDEDERPFVKDRHW